MKTACILLALTMLGTASAQQVVSPQLRANFGVDAELISNQLAIKPLILSDDWFSKSYPGTGIAVIDTSGAGLMCAQYQTDGNSRTRSFLRKMSVPILTRREGKLLMDTFFVRDYHGDDSTVFASGANKNGQSPGSWTSPVAQSVPDKNDLLDVMVHVRRDGTTAEDSLWMIAAVSLENSNGNRYFDLEMYQTELMFNASSRSFSGYGLQEGHTAWIFNPTGKIAVPGDIIFTAEYSSSSLSYLEARIWVHRSALQMQPADFQWTGTFDGAFTNSEYGYAGILPVKEATFYEGLQSFGDAWAGPFGLIRANNDFESSYSNGQLMEFAVNLTRLGLDPAAFQGGSVCQSPFRKLLIKSRASTSFTAALKDFVGPVGFMESAPVDLFTDVPLFCGVYGVSNLKILNPQPGAFYHWYTPDGHFADTSNVLSVYVDAPGTYIVSQQLLEACLPFAYDTLQITYDAQCGVVSASQLRLYGNRSASVNRLFWNWQGNETNCRPIALERSDDGLHFNVVSNARLTQCSDQFTDTMITISNQVFYRIRYQADDGKIRLSNLLRLTNEQRATLFRVYPIPTHQILNVEWQQTATSPVLIELIAADGISVYRKKTLRSAGKQTDQIYRNYNWPSGIYYLRIQSEQNQIFRILFQ